MRLERHGTTASPHMMCTVRAIRSIEPPMFVLHVALQGCLRGSDVVYGLTADTGGHIRYLLDLVTASAKDETITRIVVATRLFHDLPRSRLRRARRGDRRQGRAR